MTQPTGAPGSAPSRAAPMRIGYFGSYDTGPGYPRNDLLIAALEGAGLEVVRCHRPRWQGNAEKLSALSGGGSLRSAARLASSWRALRRAFHQAGPVDLWVAGAIAVPDMWLLKRLAAGRMPLVMDAFFSAFEATVLDRALWPDTSLRARALWSLERRCLHAADLLWTDTRLHAERIGALFDLPAERFHPLPVGSRLPRANPSALPPSPPYEILFVGTYIPLHGIEKILQAARLLEDRAGGLPPYRLTMLGTGQQFPTMRRYAQDLNLARVTWIDRLVDEAELVERYRACHLALGIFGESPKARSVIPCKVYDALGQGRAVLTGDAPALDEHFSPDEVGRCAPNGEAIANAVAALLTQPERLARLAQAGRKAFDRVASPAALAASARASLERLRSQWRPR